MPTIRGLAATALLPLALLACGGDDTADETDRPVAADATTEPAPSTDGTTTTPAAAAPEGALPDICTVVDAARVEEVMQAPPATAIGATHEGGGASCSWTIEGTTHALVVAVYWSAVGAPDDLPVLEGVAGGFHTVAGSDDRNEWVAESSSTFASDPGRDMAPVLQRLNDEVLAAVAG